MNKKTALSILFVLLGIVLVFHLLIFTECIPYDKVWAGKLNSVEEMKTFEAFSILMNAFILSVLAVKYRQLKKGIKNRFVNVLIWVFAVFFALNTVGNLFAESTIELILGTAFTLVSSVLCFIVVIKEKTQTQKNIQ